MPWLPETATHAAGENRLHALARKTGERPDEKQMRTRQPAANQRKMSGMQDGHIRGRPWPIRTDLQMHKQTLHVLVSGAPHRGKMHIQKGKQEMRRPDGIRHKDDSGSMQRQKLSQQEPS